LALIKFNKKLNFCFSCYLTTIVQKNVFKGLLQIGRFLPLCRPSSWPIQHFLIFQRSFYPLTTSHVMLPNINKKKHKTFKPTRKWKEKAGKGYIDGLKSFWSVEDKRPKKPPMFYIKEKVALSTFPYFFDVQHLGHYPNM
jgi:hypothetical protein